MSVQFPVKAKVRSTNGDTPFKTFPSEVGIFDDRGCCVSLGTCGLTLATEQLDLGLKVAKMLNAAYEQGRCDQARKIRDAINCGDKG